MSPGHFKPALWFLGIQSTIIIMIIIIIIIMIIIIIIIIEMSLVIMKIGQKQGDKMLQQTHKLNVNFKLSKYSTWRIIILR